ncbi:hypothetical protein [Mangrovibacterium sp.]|uniref:hypothetical protein n=1 Tax=Mangrovibacterium sp. TaxID=1961364 RepID=UPI0035624345
MSIKLENYNQGLIDKFFKDWIGISVEIPDDQELQPCILYLDFSSHCFATSAYKFLNDWQDFNGEQALNFSLIEESDTQISCYFFTPKYPYFKKGTFRGNFDIEKIRTFFRAVNVQPEFLVVARYADANFDVQDVELEGNGVWLKHARYRQRSKVKEGQIEFE